MSDNRRFPRAALPALLLLACAGLWASCEGTVVLIPDADAGAEPGRDAAPASPADAGPATDAEATPVPDTGTAVVPADAGTLEPSDAAPANPPDAAPVDPPDAAPVVEPPDASAPIDCTESYNVPPSTALAGWSPILSSTGAGTLTYDPAHSHDDQAGPVGFCPAQVEPGQWYLKLVSARFETDQIPPDQHCVTDYTAADPTFDQYGCCWSAGNRHIYIEVRDESGARLGMGGSEVFFYGNVVPINPDPGKPAHEFPMNFPINGGGNRYGSRASYLHPTHGQLPSDAVTNLRLPINHHVNYLLTFQVSQK